VGGHQRAVGLRDEQVAGGHASRVERREAVQSEAVGAASGSDEDSRSEGEGGHGDPLNGGGEENVSRIFARCAYQFK
jgi:hypothetical protein